MIETPVVLPETPGTGQMVAWDASGLPGGKPVERLPLQAVERERQC